MSHIYLIFFGKSQDFTFHAFDNRSYIPDFNQVIQDFDELESKIFTPDDISDEPILSKYTFIKNSKKYSLLKLYSFAQAYDSARISGSIYGVGLLSDQNIKISEININILNAAKDAFAQSSLTGLKFRSSNFLPEVEKIWKAVINHKDGNYLDKVDLEDNNIPVNNLVKAFFVKDVLKNALEPANETTSRLYYSADITHLKRTQERWGKENFPIFNIDNSLLKEKKSPLPVAESGSKINKEIAGYKLQIEDLKKDLEVQIRSNKRLVRNKRHLMATSVVLLASLAYSLYDAYIVEKKMYHTGVPQTKIIEKKPEPTKVFIDSQHQDSLVNIIEIIENDKKIRAFNSLCININNFKEKRKQNPAFVSPKSYLAIIRDAETIGIDTTLFDFYKSD